MDRVVDLKKFEVMYMTEAENSMVPHGWSKEYRDFAKYDGDFIRPPIRTTILEAGNSQEWSRILYLLKSLNQFKKKCVK